MEMSNHKNLIFANLKCLLNSARSSRYPVPVQFFPSPRKPLLHSHLYDPGVLVQLACTLHSFLSSSEHSSLSAMTDCILI